MKHYIVLNGKTTSEYTRGRINGIIYVLSGMPQMSYGYVRETEGDFDRWTTAFEGDEATRKTIVDTINKLYSDAIIQVISI